MKSLKTLLNIATDEIADEREKAAICALKAALRQVENANDALERLKNSIEDGSFSAATTGGWVIGNQQNAYVTYGS